jgi:uncharacterized protein (DUF427 family)
MSLTLADGPLSREPPVTNYRIAGPENLLLFQEFPRRVRAVLAGETVLDTRSGKLLHETGYDPQLYLPREDVRHDLLVPSDHSTNCPFKGDATYWSIRVDDAVARDAVWAYDEPLEEAGFLRGHVAVYWDRVDHWLDEDEQVEGHLPDPYHRVDARASRSHVHVAVAGVPIADSTRSVVVSETGLRNRYYLPRKDVRTEVLEPSETRALCPYKGRTSYWSVRLGDELLKDAAQSHDAPVEGTVPAADHLCFVSDGVQVWVDGERT